MVTKGKVALVLANSRWEITDYGPVTYAKGSLFGQPTVNLVGIAGKWYAAKL